MKKCSEIYYKVLGFISIGILTPFFFFLLLLLGLIILTALSVFASYVVASKLFFESRRGEA